MFLFRDLHVNLHRWIENVNLWIGNIYRNMGEIEAFLSAVQPHRLGHRFIQGIHSIGWTAQSDPGRARAKTHDLVSFWQLALKLNFHIDLRFDAGLESNRNRGWMTTLNLHP